MLELLPEPPNAIATGGVVPDDAGSVVAVTTASGATPGISLAANATSVGVLRQEQQVEDAILSLAAGQTLTTGMLYVPEGARPLHIDAADGATLAGASGSGPVIAAAAGAEVALSGTLSVPAASLGGEGTISVEDGVSMPTILLQGSPTLKISGTRRELLDYTVSGGDLTIEGPGKILTEKGSIINLGTNGVGTLRFKNVVLAPFDGTPSGGVIRVGCGMGTLVADAGAYITNQIRVGRAAGDACVVRVAGGTVYNMAPVSSSSPVMLGLGGSAAYLEITSGLYYGKGTETWGASPSQVVLDQTGGNFMHNGNFRLGAWDTQLSLMVSGGTFKSGSDIEIPDYSAGNNRYSYGDRLNYVVTVAGNGTLDLWTVNIGRVKKDNAYGSVNERANPVIFNINDGGICKVARFRRVSDYLRTDSPSSRAFVNFNGGTLRMLENECPFGVPEATRNVLGSGQWGIDRVTVFAGGATLDSNGKSATAYMPFDAPTGKSVATVPVPAEVSSRTFTAPPAIVIIGDGEGASAHPVFDRATGKVTEAMLTSPGWGYTSAKARFCCEGSAFRAESTCTLTDAADGCLKKKGTGTYTFACTNSVKSVCVSGGTLAQNVDDAFPAGATLILDGGTYDLGGRTQTFAQIVSTGAGGKVTNGTLAMAGLVVDLADAIAGKVPLIEATMSFGEGAETTIRNVSLADRNVGKYLLAYADGISGEDLPPFDDGTSAGLDKNWRLLLEGNRIMLRYDAGTMVIFR